MSGKVVHFEIPYDDGDRARSFYGEAFGATELFRLPMGDSGKIAHAEIRIGDSVIMLADEFPEFLEAHTLQPLDTFWPMVLGETGAAGVVAALGGSLLVSYTRARGESVGILCKYGIMQRAERLILLDREEQAIRFDGLPEPALLSINRGFSAPVIVEVERGPGELEALAASDTDPFARYGYDYGDLQSRLEVTLPRAIQGFRVRPEGVAVYREATGQ